MSEHDAYEGLASTDQPGMTQYEGASEFSWLASDLVIALIAVVFCTLWALGIFGATV